MIPRERVLAALNRQPPDRVPKDIGFNRRARLCCLGQDPAERFGLEVRYLTSGRTREVADFEAYLAGLPRHLRVGDRGTVASYREWGYDPAAARSRSRDSEEYDSLALDEYNPLAAAQSVAELERYHFPNIKADDRYGSLTRSVGAWHSRGLAVVGDPPHLGGVILETAQRLRGYYNLFLDLKLHPAFADYLLDQITSMCVHNCALLARAGVDVLALGDDVGEPTRMLISPEMWRRILKPRLGRIIAAAKDEKPDLLVRYHSDGYIEPIIPDLIEIGVDVLEPVQPDVMDPGALKERYGSQLAFWGTVGKQTTWSARPAPDEIRDEVRQRIASVGRGGGLLLAPAYDVEPEVPWENTRAFLEAAQEFGAC
jgi:uroporphyrinogen decarboxylase